MDGMKVARKIAGGANRRRIGLMEIGTIFLTIWLSVTSSIFFEDPIKEAYYIDNNNLKAFGLMLALAVFIAAPLILYFAISRTIVNTNQR